MMDAIITQIQLNCPTVKKVENAFTTKDYPDLENDVPAVFIAPLGGKGAPSETDNFVRQLVTKRYLFQIASPANLLDQVMAELDAALLGKQLDGFIYPFQYVEDDPLDVKPNLYWHGVVYETALLKQQS